VYNEIAYSIMGEANSLNLCRTSVAKYKRSFPQFFLGERLKGKYGGMRIIAEKS